MVAAVVGPLIHPGCYEFATADLQRVADGVHAVAESITAQTTGGGVALDAPAAVKAITEAPPEQSAQDGTADGGEGGEGGEGGGGGAAVERRAGVRERSEAAMKATWPVRLRRRFPWWWKFALFALAWDGSLACTAFEAGRWAERVEVRR